MKIKIWRDFCLTWSIWLPKPSISLYGLMTPSSWMKRGGRRDWISCEVSVALKWQQKCTVWPRFLINVPITEGYSYSLLSQYENGTKWNGEWGTNICIYINIHTNSYCHGRTTNKSLKNHLIKHLSLHSDIPQILTQCLFNQQIYTVINQLSFHLS